MRNNQQVDVFRKMEQDFFDLSSLFSLPFVAEREDYPHYPVVNHFLEEDGTEVIEVAATGFTKDEIGISFEGRKIFIKGKKEKKDEAPKKRKVFCSKLSTREFALTWMLNKFADIDKSEAKFENCILTIRVPSKEIEKPERKKISIG